MQEVVLASSNPHKLKEIEAIASGFDIKFIPVDESFDPVEDGETFVQNAYIKAAAAAKIMNKPALADDTGLCVDKLNGEPGLHSARYANTAQEKINKLLKNLEGIPAQQRTANFTCAMVLVDAKGKILHTTQGRIDGGITTDLQGVNGFGYDPVFFIPELNKTMAQISDEEKNTLSHRAKALLEMLAFIKAHRK